MLCASGAGSDAARSRPRNERSHYWRVAGTAANFKCATGGASGNSFSQITDYMAAGADHAGCIAIGTGNQDVGVSGNRPAGKGQNYG